jgi:hypothetical protein
MPDLSSLYFTVSNTASFASLRLGCPRIKVAIDISVRKISIGFVIQRNKMLIPPCDSVCLGKVSFASRNGTKRNSAKKIIFYKNLLYLLGKTGHRYILHGFAETQETSVMFAIAGTPATAGLGLGTEFRSAKIPRNSLGTVSVIPRKKAVIPRHSEFRGRANFEARNGTERNGMEFRGNISFTKQQQNNLTKLYVCISKVVFF